MLKIAKNAGFNLINSLVIFFTGLGASIYAARVLGPDNYGEYSFILWVFTSLLILGDIGISSALEKYVAELEGSNLRNYANRLTSLLFFTQISIGILLGLFLMRFSQDISEYFNLPIIKQYSVVFSIGIPIGLSFSILRGRLAGFQRYDLISLISITAGIFTFIGTILLLIFKFGIKELLILTVGIYAYQFIMSAIILWSTTTRFKGNRLPKSILQKVLRYCIGAYIISSFNLVVWQRSETFFLGHFSKTAEIGFYGLAYSISSTLVTLVPFALSGVLLPALSHSFGAGEKDQIQKIYSLATKYIALISIPISIGSIALARPLIQLVFGVNYSPAIWPLRILLIASLFCALTGPGSALFLALGKPYLAALWGIPIAILNLVLAFILTQRYGAVGAAIANTASQIIGVSVGTIYLLHFKRYKLPINSMVRTLISAIISACISYLLVTFLDGWISLLLAIISGAFLYIIMLIILQVITPTDFGFFREVINILPKLIATKINRFVDILESASILSRVSNR